MTIHVGTCSWTDPTLVKSTAFYPRTTMSAEERLKFYAEHFNTVEVDSTFCALPSEKVVGLQTLRTPDDFTLHYKAFGLLTQHTVEVSRLPRAIKGLLDQEASSQRRLRFQDAPDRVLELAFQMFRSALLPAESAAKLGVVLFQFPPYFTFSPRNLDYLRLCRQMLPEYRIGVEFRHSSWVDEANLKSTLGFLADNDLGYVCVDEPQFATRHTVPPMACATAGFAYVRMHGRNTDNWYRRGISTAERFAYLYTDEELDEWLPKIRELERQTTDTYVMFNNCHSDYAVRNAARIVELLR